MSSPPQHRPPAHGGNRGRGEDDSSDQPPVGFEDLMRDIRDRSDAEKWSLPRLDQPYMASQDQRSLGIVLRHLIPKGARILDLFSGAYSYFPAELSPREVVGVGLIGDELAANQQLTSFRAHDLNEDPGFIGREFPAGHFDAATLTLGAPYLRSHVELFKAVGRVLGEGGVLLIAYSNIGFDKNAATSAWNKSSPEERGSDMMRYIREAGCFTDLDTHDLGNGFNVVIARRS